MKPEMKKLKVMIVEDEIIVAKDIQRILTKLGYEAHPPFSSAQKALDAIETVKPDFILLDINLRGSEMDGIDLAKQIHEHYHIPFLFLTAFSDKSTLDRAKLTEPYGYIIKPFEEDDIRSAIEIAHYKYTKDLEVKNTGNRFAAALEKVDMAVIITDANNKVTFLNKSAESLTGTSRTDALGKDNEYVFRHSPEQSKSTFKMLAHASDPNTVGTGLTAVISNGTEEKKMNISWFPILSVNNKLNGAALVLGSSSVQGASPLQAESGTDKNLMNFLENVYSSNSFFIKKDSRFVKVNFKEVLWIEALDNYVVIKTQSKEQFIIHSSMKDIEMRLPQLTFVRIHRSYIIQLDKISAMEENAVIIDGTRLAIGKSFKDGLLSRLKMF
jgi:PAS domain S-box-containing protein